MEYFEVYRCVEEETTHSDGDAVIVMATTYVPTILGHHMTGGDDEWTYKSSGDDSLSFIELMSPSPISKDNEVNTVVTSMWIPRL